MRNWLLTSIGLLAVTCTLLSGCSSPSQVDGFIDKSGKLVVDVSKLSPRPVAIGDYNEDYAPVQFASGVGALDKSGTIVFQKSYRHIGQFSEGRAPFSLGSSDADQLWGFIDTKGDTVVQPLYAEVGKFSEGVAAVKMPATSSDKKLAGRWVYIDDKGKPIFNQGFEQAGPFSEGLAAVKMNGRMGTVNRHGNFVVQPLYDVVYAANDGTIVAAQGDGLSGPNCNQELDYYDNTGHKTVHKTIHGVTLQNLRPLMWVKWSGTPADKAKESDDLHRPLSTFVSPGYSEKKSIGQAGDKFVIEQSFNARAFAGGFDYIYPVSDGYSVVYSDADGGKLDYRGGVPEDASGIWNSKVFRFYDCAPYSNGLGMVQEKKGGPYGYIDKSANFVLKPIYTHARPFKNDRALVGESALHNI